MKILKILGGILLFIILGILALGIFGPKNLNVERSKVINASPEIIFQQVSDFSNMHNWSPWNELDPNMKMTNNTEHTSGMGASYSWEGNEQVGKGTQEFTEVVLNEKATSKLIFDGSNDTNYSTFYLAPADGGTKVTWDFKGGDSNFIGRVFNVLFKGSIEESYDKGLDNLAAYCEKQ